MSSTVMTNGQYPGAGLFYYVRRAFADENGTTMGPSAELLRTTGWANRAILRKRTHTSEDAGVNLLERTTRPNCGRGPYVYVLNGGDNL